MTEPLMPPNVGCRVMLAGWLEYPDYQHFARYGTILQWHLHLGLRLFTVRWDAGMGVPEHDETVLANSVTWLWWRST